MENIFFETERIIVRKWSFEDVTELYDVMSDTYADDSMGYGKDREVYSLADIFLWK